jgi:hypothetical protein
MPLKQKIQSKLENWIRWNEIVSNSVQSQEIRIPVPDDVDPDEIIKQIQDKNNDL